MNDDNTQDGAEPSLASAGSHNTHMATARLSAGNTWLQEEIKRLRLTDEEREAIEKVLRRVREDYFTGRFADSVQIAAVIDGLLERTK
jgi:hypothetical protein